MLRNLQILHYTIREALDLSGFISLTLLYKFRKLIRLLGKKDAGAFFKLSILIIDGL